METASDIRVFYGFDTLPGPESSDAAGGIVKFQALQGRFPNHPGDHDLLALVSSRLPPGALSLVSAARERGVKLLYSQAAPACPATHDTRWQKLNEPLVALVHEADHVFYQSHFGRRLADAYLGARSGAAEILYNAVDTSALTPARSDPDPRRLVVLLGGTQYRLYRLQVGLRTFAAIRRQRPDAVLLVSGRLGWGPDPAEARRIADALVAELGLGGYVTFLGPYAQRDAPALYRRAHVLMHTMALDCCPTVVIEAMACGLPVAYAASGGVPELVGPDAGVAVPSEEDFERLRPPDPEALALAVVEAAERRATLGEAGRQRAVERFDRAAWCRRYGEVIEGLV